MKSKSSFVAGVAVSEKADTPAWSCSQPQLNGCCCYWNKWCTSFSHSKHFSIACVFDHICNVVTTMDF
jgi:hypothetical protein